MLKPRKFQPHEISDSEVKIEVISTFCFIDDDSEKSDANLVATIPYPPVCCGR